MANNKEYYNRTSEEYVKKWDKIDMDPENPKFYFRKVFMGMMTRFADVKPGSRVVEIGCGTGLVLREMLKITKPVFGVDVSEEMLRRVQDSVLRDYAVKIVPGFDSLQFQSDTDVFLAVDDFTDLKIPKGLFDHFLSMEVLRYIKDKDVCFKNISNIMSSDSIFVFSVTNLWSLNLFPLKFTIRKILGLVKPSEIMQYFVTERSLRRQLQKNNFTIVGFEKCQALSTMPGIRTFIKTRRDAEFWDNVDKKISRIPILRNFFDTFIVVVRKKS